MPTGPSATITYEGAKPEIQKYHEPAVVLTPKPSPRPRINGAKVVGVRPGSPFLFTIAATGERPMTYEAEGLPEGLQLDPATGIITGSLDARGEHRVKVTVTNSLGTGQPRPAHRRGRPPGAHASHGLELVELLRQRRDREERPRRGRRLRQGRPPRPRLDLHQHRRFLDAQERGQGPDPARTRPRPQRQDQRQPPIPGHEGPHRLHPRPRA